MSERVCGNCGEPIAQRYAGTFWKAPDPMPMMWVHVASNDRACGYAYPHEEPPCDHPGISHDDPGLCYCWPCPACGVCKFIGHGPVCLDCLTATA